jgi:hypothetical protein
VVNDGAKGTFGLKCWVEIGEPYATSADDGGAIGTGELVCSFEGGDLGFPVFLEELPLRLLLD